jgi:alkylated DNA repair dioxygenase AlkB
MICILQKSFFVFLTENACYCEENLLLSGDPNPNWPNELQFIKGWLSAQAAHALYTKLLAGLEWQIPQVRVYGKWHPTPRRVVYIGDPGTDYPYSGQVHRPQTWTPELLELRKRLQGERAWEPNAVLCNHYRTGADSMGWHRDDEAELGPDPCIASLSLGAGRDFDLRSTDGTSKIRLHLEHGDLLWMGPGIQSRFEHAIPKRSKHSGRTPGPSQLSFLEQNGPHFEAGRINLTFRWIPNPHGATDNLNLPQ